MKTFEQFNEIDPLGEENWADEQDRNSLLYYIYDKLCVLVNTIPNKVYMNYTNSSIYFDFENNFERNFTIHLEEPLRKRLEVTEYDGYLKLDDNVKYFDLDKVDNCIKYVEKTIKDECRII